MQLNKPFKVSTNRISTDDIARINRIRDRIMSEPSYRYKVPDLARQAGMNVTKLCEGFKYLNGQTLGQFINDTRVAHSRHILETSRKPVYLVSEEAGYSSAIYFAHCFRKAYGCSPIEYRSRRLQTATGA